MTFTEMGFVASALCLQTRFVSQGLEFVDEIAGCMT